MMRTVFSHQKQMLHTYPNDVRQLLRFSIYYQLIIIIMENQEFQQVMEEDPVQQIVDGIETNKMENMAHHLRQSWDKQGKIVKAKSIEFDESLHLDVSIDTLLGKLQNIKVSLSQLRLNHLSGSHKQSQSLSLEIDSYKKTILLRESQLGMLVYLLSRDQKILQGDFTKNYLEQYGFLQKFMIPVNNIYDKFNVFILNQIFEKELGYLQDYSTQIELLRKNIVKKESISQRKNNIKVLNAKLITIAEVFSYACITPEEDLFSFPKNHQRWQNLFKKCIDFKIFGPKDKITISFNKLRANLNLVNASMSLAKKRQNLSVFNIKDWKKLLQSNNEMIKVALFKGSAEKEAAVMISEGDNELAKEIWNLPEKKMLKGLISASLPSIVYSEKIYIPRTFKDYLESNGKLPLPDLFITHRTQYGNELFDPKEYKEKLMLRINCPFMLRRIYDEPKPKETIFNLNKLTNMFKSNTEQIPEKLIYHIHGGGFISMSTFFHQTYTRNWAQRLSVPIISVQYGKAPEHPFPEGLYDCFEGYMWALTCFRQVFNVQPNKIILVGDSAGGNLVAALTTLLIELNLPKPTGIVLVYPALNLNYFNYTPSLLTALNDMILPHTFLKVCLKEYLKNPNLKPEQDPLISPIRTSDETLSRYPRTRIFVGNEDPFHDDCCRLAQKINNLNPGNVRLTIFQQFPHGFLQFDSNLQPHEECRKATKEVEMALKQMLQFEN